MSRPACEGAGKPGLCQNGYTGRCPVCGDTFRLNKRGEVYPHKAKLAQLAQVSKSVASLILVAGNPYETATEIVFGPGLVLRAVRYDMSDPSLPFESYHHMWGGVSTEAAVQLNVGYGGDAGGWRPDIRAPIPEPAYWLTMLLVLAVILVTALRRSRPKWGRD